MFCVYLFAESRCPPAVSISPAMYNWRRRLCVFLCTYRKGVDQNISGCMLGKEAETKAGVQRWVCPVFAIRNPTLGGWVGNNRVQSSVASIVNDSGCRFACTRCVLCMITYTSAQTIYSIANFLLSLINGSNTRRPCCFAALELAPPTLLIQP